MNTECNRTEAATFSSRVASIREIERRRVPFKTNPGHTPICNAKKYQFFKTLNANRISKNFLSRTVTLYNDIANSIDSSFFSDTPILFFFLYNPCLCSSRNVDANQHWYLVRSECLERFIPNRECANRPLFSRGRLFNARQRLLNT